MARVPLRWFGLPYGGDLSPSSSSSVAHAKSSLKLIAEPVVSSRYQRLGRRGFTWTRGETDDDFECGHSTRHYLTDSEAAEVVEEVMNVASVGPRALAGKPVAPPQTSRTAASAARWLTRLRIHPGPVGTGGEGWRLEPGFDPPACHLQ